MSRQLILKPLCASTVPPVFLNAGDTLTVGRSAQANCSVPFDEFMSGRHFCLEFHPPHASVRDLDSRNGTALNGSRVHYAHLNDGDQIVAGATVFVVRFRTSDMEATLPDPHRGQVSVDPDSSDLTIRFPKS